MDTKFKTEVKVLKIRMKKDVGYYKFPAETELSILEWVEARAKLIRINYMNYFNEIKQHSELTQTDLENPKFKSAIENEILEIIQHFREGLRGRNYAY